MISQVRSIVAAGFSGALFAIGLLVSGMADPANVLGFLDISGDFRPDLAWVMMGALAVYLPLYRVVSRRAHPFFVRAFAAPTSTTIDARLVIGAVVFGIGWGLWGYCPGPALVAFGAGSNDATIFVAAMVAGMVAFRWFNRDSTSKRSL